MKNKIFIILFLIFLFSFNLFLFAKAENNSSVVQIPNTIDEAKKMGEGLLPLIPNIVGSMWTDGVGVIKSIFKFTINTWNKYIYPQIDKYLGSTIEKRKPIIEEEFKKETQEMQSDIKQEIPKVTKSIWDKNKGDIKQKLKNYNICTQSP